METACPIGSILAGLSVQGRLGSDAGFPVLYFLALAAAGLLAVSKNRSRPLILLLLAALWTAMAVGYHVTSPGSDNPLVHKAIEILALLQAMLFLALIAEPDAVRFEPRDGNPWRLAGSALLLYSLAVYPLLGILTGGRTVGMYIAGLPFPPLAFTLGILFFLAKPFPPLLWIPLLGAAAGGLAGTRLDDAHLWALRLVFIAGCLFTFLPWETWAGREKRKELYEKLQRRRATYEAPLLVMVLFILALLFAWENGAPLEPVLIQLSTSLGLLAITGLVLWMAFPAWLNPGFRMVALPVAKGAGRLWAWFKGAWKWIALLLVTVSLVDYVTLKTAGKSPLNSLLDIHLTEHGHVGFLAAAFLLWLIYLAYQGRNRLVIQPFETNTEDDDLKKHVKGIRAQLRNDLARLGDLYRVIDEASPRPSGSVVEVTVEVQDVGEILKESAGTTPIKIFGGVELPTDFLFSLVSRLVKGPRITGSLLGGGKEPVLVAELSGGGMRGNWRVDVTKLDKEERSLPMEALLRTMTEQMAFRIATQIVSIGSPRWRAVRCFTDGLRYYRETQRTDKDRDLNLRKAERCLLDAAKEDEKFAQSHYNLGVVYQQLGELGSAKSAFRWALREDPGSYEAWYALAKTSVEEHAHDEALQFCEAAVDIDPVDARAWDLKGYAWRQRRQEKGRLASRPEDPVWEEVLPFREMAVALAWRELCRSALSGPGPILAREQGTAALCTRNLAMILSRMGRHEESRLVVRQAIALAAHDPELRFVLGRILYLGKQWSAAKDALIGGLDDSTTVLIERTLKWATLTQVYKQKGSPAEARTALKRLLDQTASIANPKGLETWRKALDDCQRYPSLGTGKAWIRRLLGFRSFLEILHPGPGPGRPERVNGGGVADLVLLHRLRSTLRKFLWKKGKETRDEYRQRIQQHFKEYLAAAPEPHKKALRKLGLGPALFKEPFDEAALGWEWAYCQIQVKLARLHLERSEIGARRAEHAKAAKAALEDAIPRLEAHGFQQPQEQGLQALLARATLAHAEAQPHDAPERVRLLHDALVQARRAAEMNPESAQERVSLVKVYSALGDYQQAKEESELCVARDNSPEILRLVGSCFWARAAAASGRATRRSALKDAVSFFKRTLDLIEKQAFQGDQPFEQIQSHAWGHYWLGRFLCELLKYEQGAAHQEIARSMGFKPLESCVNLGLAYLADGDLDRAQAAFTEAKRVAGRDPSRRVADGEGEDRPIHDLLFEVHLGQAFLHLKRGLAPDGARPFINEAQALLDPGERSAAVHEALAWMHFQSGRLADSQQEALLSLELAARGGAYVCLAKILMEDSLLLENRRSAREACDRALRADVSGQWKAEIDALLAQLDKPAEADAQPKPSGGGSPAVVP